MPVIAAIERGVERMRGTGIGIAVHGMTDVVGILCVQALERETGEAGRRRRVHRNRSIATDRSRNGGRPTHCY